MNNANKHSLQKAKSLDHLATLICGYGDYAYHNNDREHPIPKEAVKEYLEVGAAFQKQQRKAYLLIQYEDSMSDYAGIYLSEKDAQSALRKLESEGEVGHSIIEIPLNPPEPYFTDESE